MSLQIEAGLDVILGRLSDALDRNTKSQRDTVRALKATGPSDVRIQQSGTSAGSGDLCLVIPGPDTGYYWHVRRLVIGGAAYSSTVAGTGEVYVTAINNAAYVNIRDTADLADQLATLPNKNFYGQHEFVVQAGENVVIVIHTPTASTLYKAALQAQQFRSLPYDGVDFTA